jgi:hypothetical protein
MKRWQAIATALLALLILLFVGATAHAQSFEQLPPLMAGVITKTAVIVNSLLSHWVTGNSLTDPQGIDLVGQIAQTAVNTVHFLAQVVVLLSS